MRFRAALLVVLTSAIVARSGAVVAQEPAAVGEPESAVPGAPESAALGPEEVPPDCRATPNDPRCHPPRPSPEGPVSAPAAIPTPGSGKPTAPKAGGGGGSGGSCSGLGGGGGGGGNLGVGILVVAVIAVAALPVIVYFVDDDAPQGVQDKYRSTSAAFNLGGGAVTTGNGWAPVGTARATAGWFFLGANAEAQTATDPSVYSLFAGHLLLRPPPKAHLEGGLALGFEQETVLGTRLRGFDVALPHTYVFRPGDPVQLGIEARPAVLIHNHGADVRLELGMSVLLGHRVSVEVLGQAFSFAGQAQLGAVADVGLHI